MARPAFVLETSAPLTAERDRVDYAYMVPNRPADLAYILERLHATGGEVRWIRTHEADEDITFEMHLRATRDLHTVLHAVYRVV